MTDPQQAAWGRLHKPSPRRPYEHQRTWEKRNKQRLNFTSKIELSANGCWVWTGAVYPANGRDYPRFAYKDLNTKQMKQPSAFKHLLTEFLPEYSATGKHRTAPGCGNDRCINPWHREDRRVTRQVITAQQAREIYAAKGSQDPAAVARSVGIGRDAVLAIWCGKRWGGVTGANRVVRWTLDDDTIRAILTAKDSGRSASDVSREFGCGRTTVQRVWRGDRKPRNLSDKQAAW